MTVQTTNGARSGLITRENIDDIALKGRDFAGMLKLLPGVIDTRNREAPGWENMNNLSINGRTSFNFSYDGVTNKDTGQNGANYAAPALDSIAEIRVQTSNFQAEYGRSSGATITVITRSGSKDFRGSAAYYKRDKGLNGNEFLRRQQCRSGQTINCQAADYTFDNTAWTLGGPVLIPGTSFNKDRNKLFFFWSQDWLARTDPGGLNQRRMPTALEREGNFSQTRDQNNQLIFVRDPLLTGNCAANGGGPACFPNNIIPANRIDPIGKALLNVLPMPNATDPTGANQYNYTFQTVQDWPRNDQVARVDWNIAPKTTAYGRLQFGYEKRSGGVSLLGSSGGWPQMATKYEIDTRQLREHAAPHLQPDDVCRVHGRRELGASVHEPVRSGGRRCQRPPARPAGPAAVLSVCEPVVSAAAGRLRRRSSGDDRVGRRRAAVPVLRLQHALERLRQRDEAEGRAQPEDGGVRRAHDPAGRAVLELQRQPQLRQRRGQPAQHQRRVRQRTDRSGHGSTRSPTATRRRTASSSSPSGTRRTTGA